LLTDVYSVSPAAGLVLDALWRALAPVLRRPVSSPLES
jgi:hypothetical protein